jgi:thiol:disulfide interchange protein DsbA
MKRHLILALLTALALTACGGDKPAADTAKPAATTEAAKPADDAALMAAAEAAAKASTDPNAPAQADATPAQDPAAATAPAASGEAIPGLKLGTDYELIKNGLPFEPLDGKIEVVEVFNFVCPACYAFQPTLSKWEKALPANVRFTYVPAAFGPKWDQYVRAFYAAQMMGIEGKSHGGIYDAIHLENKLQGEHGDDSDEAIAAVYAKLGGVDARQFAANMKSFAVMAKFNKAKQYIVQQQVNGTPTLMVNGKYRVTGGRTPEDRMRIVDLLIAHESAQGGQR